MDKEKTKESWRKASNKLHQKKVALGLKKRLFYLIDEYIPVAKELERKSIEQVNLSKEK